MNCLQQVTCYFPQVHKMKKFLVKFDHLLKQQRAENQHKVTELQKQMRMNKVMMKVCVDIELSIHEQLGSSTSTNFKHVYELSKFAIQLHKSIQKYEGQDFKFALSMFPNKIRCESDNICLGERKIVTLMKENIIRPVNDEDQVKEALRHYKQIKKKAKSELKGKKKTKKSRRSGDDSPDSVWTDDQLS